MTPREEYAKFNEYSALKREIIEMIEFDKPIPLDMYSRYVEYVNYFYPQLNSKIKT
jgi:hypothetical protein